MDINLAVLALGYVFVCYMYILSLKNFAFLNNYISLYS